MGKAGNAANLVELLVVFQSTGAGFDRLWEVIGPLVGRLAVNRLRRHLVFDRPGRVDQTAIEEVRQQVGLKLLRLASPEQGGRFDLERSVGGVAGVSRWLFGIVSNEVADYCRTWRNGRSKLKTAALTAADLNTLAGPADVAKSTLPKGSGVDVAGILNHCIDRLPAELAAPVRLRLLGFTDRNAGKELGCSGSTVNKRIAKAMKMLRPMLEAEGIDSSALETLAV